MAAMVLAAARLLFGGRPARPPSRHDFRALAVLAGALVIVSTLQAADLFALEAERLFVAGLAAAAVAMAVAAGRGRARPPAPSWPRWPSRSAPGRS